jgi:two-component system chemotaxis response regulator CheY
MSALNPPNILIVDDQELMYRVVQATLKPLGARLSWAKSGAEAINHIETVGVPDVIVLDFSMPDQDGVETLSHIRKLASGESIPVLMLTARDQTHIRQEAEGLKVHSFMTKPFSPNLLLGTIRDIFANLPPKRPDSAK